MRRQIIFPHATALALLIDTVMPFPPDQWAYLPASWRVVANGASPEFSLFIEADAASNLTVARLYGATRTPGTIASTSITAVDATANTLTHTAHGRLSGDGPVLPVGVDLPLPLNATTPVWVIRVDADTIQFAATLEDAWNEVPINLTTTGSGTRSFIGTADTQLVRWAKHVTIDSGTIPLDVREAYRSPRIAHNPDVEAYAIRGTLSAAVNVKVSMLPVSDV